MYGIRSANGHKLRQDPTKLRSIAPQTLYEFYERNMSYKNLVYCASGMKNEEGNNSLGVNHKEFVEAIQKNMPTLTSKALSEPTPDMLEYGIEGGYHRVEWKDQDISKKIGQRTKSMLAYPSIPAPGEIPVWTKGSNWRELDVFAIMLLQTLLGGGSSFSSGGPGKGMFSKLYMDILYKYSFVESAQVYVTPLKECGISRIVLMNK